jgi:hypothetical protein
MANAYVQNSESVTSETFDDDTVLINFLTGAYFSLRGSAPAIWSSMQTPISLDKIVEAVPEDATGARAAIERMLEVLVAEDCVRKIQVDESEMGQICSMNVPYEFPKIEVFRDLAELISIDPVHEVDDDDGWPHRTPTLHSE